MERNNRGLIVSTILIMTIAIGCDYVVLDIFNKIASFVPLIKVDGRSLMYLVLYASFIYYLWKEKHFKVRNRPILFAFILIFVTILVINCYLKWDILSNYISTSNVIDIIFLYVPVFLFIRNYDDYSRITRYLWISATITFSFAVYVALNYQFHIQQGYETNMVLGFTFTLIVLIMAEKLRQPYCAKILRIILIIISLVSLYFVVLYGNRGSFIILACYFIYMLFDKIKRHMILLVGIPIVLILIVIFWNQIINYILNSIQIAGISSRTLAWLFGQDSNLNSSGRIELWQSAFNYVDVIGSGPFGDYKFWNGYIHNLFIELLLNYGILLGTCSFVFIILGGIKALTKSHTRNIASIFVIYSIIQLEFSSSYLINCNFWIMLGIIFCAIDGGTSNEAITEEYYT